MARRTFPRRDDHHRVAAAATLDKHARRTGRPISLPVPIELIIESTYGLEVLVDTIDEPPDTMILGMLVPQQMRIVLNERHAEMFNAWVGPERFTLAHELAHWIYDAESPNQLSMDFEAAAEEQFCYHRDAPGLPDDLRLREVNANKLASHLLMPEHLMRATDIEMVLGDFRGVARRWGVSQQALRIRLEGLGLIDDSDLYRLDFEG